MKVLDKYAKYGEPLQWAVIGSAIVVCIFGGIMPRWAILTWGVCAFIVATIGFFLNDRQIEIQHEARRKEFEKMLAQQELIARRKQQ